MGLHNSSLMVGAPSRISFLRLSQLTHCRGIMATCQAAAQSWRGMMALRFFMGAAEAGFGPGVPYLMSFFYRRRELGLRCGLFLSAAPLANTFAGALAYGITSGHSRLANWRLLFLVEGLPTLLAIPIAWFCLPDSPAEAKFLTEEEKEVARARGLRRAGEEQQTRGIVWKDIGLTLMDAKAWFTAVGCKTVVLVFRVMANLIIVLAHVLQLQCQLLVPASLSPDNSERNGLHCYQRPRTHCASIFPFVPGDDLHNLDCRSITAAWFDDCFSLSHGLNRIRSSGRVFFCWGSLFWRVPRC